MKIQIRLKHPIRIINDDPRLISISLDDLKQISVGGVKKFYGDKLKCKHCHMTFGVNEDIMCVITCPYCAEYVEG
jgi:cytochrome c